MAIVARAGRVAIAEAVEGAGNAAGHTADIEFFSALQHGV